MKVNEIELPVRAELMLWLPKDGFSDNFLRVVAEACLGFPDLDEAYLALRGKEGMLLFALQMSESSMNMKSANDMVAGVMEGLMPLFDEDVQVDAICLNGHPEIRASISALTLPFYKKQN